MLSSNYLFISANRKKLLQLIRLKFFFWSSFTENSDVIWDRIEEITGIELGTGVKADIDSISVSLSKMF